MTREELNKKYEDGKITKSELHSEKGKLNDRLEARVDDLVSVLKSIAILVEANRKELMVVKTNHIKHIQDEIDNIKKDINDIR